MRKTAFIITMCVALIIAVSACSAYKAPSQAQHDDLNSVLDAYLRKDARLRNWRVLDTQVSWAS